MGPFEEYAARGQPMPRGARFVVGDGPDFVTSSASGLSGGLDRPRPVVGVPNGAQDVRPAAERAILDVGLVLAAAGIRVRIARLTARRAHVRRRFARGARMRGLLPLLRAQAGGAPSRPRRASTTIKPRLSPIVRCAADVATSTLDDVRTPRRRAKATQS